MCHQSYNKFNIIVKTERPVDGTISKLNQTKQTKKKNKIPAQKQSYVKCYEQNVFNSSNWMVFEMEFRVDAHVHCMNGIND